MPSDAVLTGVIAGVAAELAGRTLSSILDAGARRRTEGLQRLFIQLDERLSRLECRCDPRQFSDLIVKVVAASMADSRGEKLLVFQRILAGAYDGTLDDLSGRLFTDYAARLDLQHLFAICVLRDSEGTDRGSDGAEPGFHTYEVVHAELQSACGRTGPEFDDVVAAALNDLVACGLVRSRMRSESTGRLIINLNPTGLLRMQLFSLSALGRSFSAYIERNV